MKCCLGVLLLVAGVVAGLFLVVIDPAAPDQVSHAWNQIATAIHHPASPPAPTAYPTITLAPATTTPTAAHVAVAWTVFDCAFAVDTLNEDRILDGQAFADGLSPAADPYYYAREAQGWAQAAADAVQQCKDPGTLAGTACTAPPAAFALAILSHQGDVIEHPANAAWDAMWIASYRRLERLWAVACPGAVG